ncbi:mechanosensitive ion channel domain-containing protein [Phenylobacterium sp.]|uniref:mechanosensitive ion channel family protein n=1 Tax=Phenylobacterium sp. TaxID=1871053 RepID=UPI0030F41A62
MEKLSDAAWAWVATGQWLVPARHIAVSAGIIVAGFLAARLVSMALSRWRDRVKTGRPIIYIVEKLSGYALVLTGLFVALSTLGINLTSLAVFAGAVGVGVGLGLQGVVREFVSGLVLIFDPNVQVGDFIELENGVRGIIAEVGPRASRVRTNDGLNVVIPNSKLIESQVINWTLKGGTRRIHVPFSVAYGVDKALVRDVVIKAAQATSFTLPESERHKTQVWLTGFGDSALNFELVVWPTFEAVKRPAAMHAAYTWAIEDALRSAEIEIPFPQVDLRVRSLFGQEGSEAFKAVGLETARAKAHRPHAPAETTNDAADALVADVEQEARDRQAPGRDKGD